MCFSLPGVGKREREVVSIPKVVAGGFPLQLENLKRVSQNYQDLPGAWHILLPRELMNVCSGAVEIAIVVVVHLALLCFPVEFKPQELLLRNGVVGIAWIHILDRK